MIDIKNGDCLELMKNIPDNSVDMILTDPPIKLLQEGMVVIAEVCFKRKK